MTENGLNKAMEIVDVNYSNHKVLIVYEPSIHESIAGIIAGRLKDHYYRPTIVLTDGKVDVKGSARSIEGYNIFEELSKESHILEKFGGHPMAAGMSLKEGYVDKLRVQMNSNCPLTEEDLIPKVYIDMQLPINYIDFKLLEDMKSLEPFGKGNPKPLFGEKNLKIKRSRVLGVNKNVIRLELVNQRNDCFTGILFSKTEGFLNGIKNKYGDNQLNNVLKGLDNDIMIDILYCPEINEYKGTKSIQLKIDSFRFK